MVPVPDSGVPAAVGYSQHSGVPFELGIIRNHYVGRTFIQPTQSVRELGVRMKHSANRAAIEGKRIILIDDSLVRGTTSKKIVRMMRDAGAREVHFRLASPPILYPDYYGIDLPDRGGLLAATHSLEEMRRDHRRRLAGVPVDRRHVPRHGRARPRSRQSEIRGPLLYRRLSHPPHRPDPGRAAAAATVAAGGSELSILSSLRKQGPIATSRRVADAARREHLPQS